MTDTQDRSELAGAQRPIGYWASVWKRYRRHGTGMIGLVCLTFLAGLAFFTPMLAGGQPVVCKYKGEIYFPAVVSVFHKLPFGEDIYSMPKPFRFPSFEPKVQVGENEGDWAVPNLRASSMASSMTTRSGVSVCKSSKLPRRRTLRSVGAIRDNDQFSATA